MSTKERNERKAKAAAGIPKQTRGKAAGQAAEKTAAMKQAYLDARAEGMFAYRAAKIAGISRHTIGQWRSDPWDGEAFRAAEDAARDHGVSRVKDTISEIMEDPERFDQPTVSLKAAETLLRFEAVATSRLEVAGPGGRPVQIQIDPDEERIRQATAAWSSRILGEIDAEDDHSQE